MIPLNIVILEPRSLDFQIVFVVKPDPEPKKSLGNLSGQSAMMQTDAHRPGLANLLKLQRRMTRVFFEQQISFVSQLLDFRRELPVMNPEFSGCPMAKFPWCVRHDNPPSLPPLNSQVSRRRNRARFVCPTAPCRSPQTMRGIS